MEEENLFQMNEKETDRFWNHTLERLRKESGDGLCDIINGNCLLYSYIREPNGSDLPIELVKKVETHVDNCWFCSEYYREKEIEDHEAKKAWEEMTGKTDLRQRIRYNKRVTRDGAEWGMRILYLLEEAREPLSLEYLTKATFHLEKKLGLLEQGTQDFLVLLGHLVRKGYVMVKNKEEYVIPDLSTYTSDENFCGEYMITSKGCNVVFNFKPYLSKRFHLDERTITTILDEIKKD